ncbi:MAG: hypothetical protein V1804_01265 [Patescibacteria group bacterium]
MKKIFIVVLFLALMTLTSQAYAIGTTGPPADSIGTTVATSTYPHAGTNVATVTAPDWDSRSQKVAKATTVNNLKKSAADTGTTNTEIAPVAVNLEKINMKRTGGDLTLG